MKDPVKDKLKRLEIFDRFQAICFHPTIGAAVDDYVAAFDVNWTP
jgi:hypothetical protein